MIPVASQVAADGRYQPLFFLSWDATVEHVRLLRQVGLLVAGPGTTSKSSSNRSQLHTARKSLVSLKKCARWAVPTGLRRALSAAADYTRKKREANALCKRESVAALVLIGDRHVGWETALIRAANQQGIPSLIVPFALSSRESSAEWRLKRSDANRRYGMQSLSNRIAGKLFPNWVYEYEGKRLLFYPGTRAIVALILGMMPENPWALGGGAATRMAVESSHLRRMFVQQGVPEEKMVVTGKPSVDQMYEAMQPARQHFIREELGIPEAGHVLLCALPAYPQSDGRDSTSWSRHLQETEFLLATFAQLKNVSVVLSLHPKSSPLDYQHLANQYGAVMAKRRIYELIPVCDVFVATVSSTVMLAIGTGKPTVVISFHGSYDEFYDNLPGVIVLRSPDQLKSTLSRLFSDPQYYNQLAEAQRQQASEWILLDGKCTERVVEELYGLIEDSVHNRLT